MPNSSLTTSRPAISTMKFDEFPVYLPVIRTRATEAGRSNTLSPVPLLMNSGRLFTPVPVTLIATRNNGSVN